MENRHIFDTFPEESFPVVPPLSSLQHQVPLHEISKTLHQKPGAAASDLAPPDTAVIAEIERFIGIRKSSRSVLCALGGSPLTMLCIRNAVCSTDDHGGCSMFFPPARIAITSGIYRFKPGKDGFRVIYVACPAAVEFLEMPKEFLPRKDWDAKRRCLYLIKASNDELAGSDPDIFRAGISFLTAMGIAAEAKLENLVAESLVDYALCMNKLERYEEVIRSCDKALKINPRHYKAMLNKGLALLKVQSFREALVNLRVAKALLSRAGFSEGQALQNTLMLDNTISEFTKVARQQESGEYDVRDFFLGPKKNTPKWPDFTSEAIEIRRTGDGRGRGVFITRDVRAGELLMVSNPLLASDSLENLQVEAIRACGWSSQVRRTLKLLRDPDSDEELPLPSTGDFVYSGKLESGSIDVERIKRVVNEASKLRLPVDSPITGRMSYNHVFGLPNLINHSCLPNASFMVVDSALFVRAATPIRAGEEIAITYIDCLRPLAHRSRTLGEFFGFSCSCRRCEVERRFGEELLLVPEICCSKRGDLKLLELVVRQLESLLAEWNLTDEERGMIRVGYVRDYIDVHRNGESSRGREMKLISDIEAMKLMREFAPGSGQSIRLITGLVRRYVLRLDWNPGFEAEFDDAIKCLIGDVVLPSEDYLTIFDRMAGF